MPFSGHNQQEIRPDSYYFIKGDVILSLRRELEQLAADMEEDVSKRVNGIAALIPESPAYAFT